MQENILINLIMSAIVSIPFGIWVWKKAENGQWVLWYTIILILIWYE